MKPEITDLPGMLLAGVIDCGTDVRSIDIKRLWEVYEKHEARITHRIQGSWWEVHVGENLGNGIYSVLAGVQISEIGPLPVEVVIRAIPAGTYAHFTHRMGDGGFGEAFAQVARWEKETGTRLRDFGLQRYGTGFDPSNGESILHIFMPLAG